MVSSIIPLTVKSWYQYSTLAVFLKILPNLSIGPESSTASTYFNWTLTDDYKLDLQFVSWTSVLWWRIFWSVLLVWFSFSRPSCNWCSSMHHEITSGTLLVTIGWYGPFSSYLDTSFLCPLIALSPIKLTALMKVPETLQGTTLSQM